MKAGDRNDVEYILVEGEYDEKDRFYRLLSRRMAC